MNIWKLLNFSFNIKNDFFDLQENSQQWQNDSLILHNVDLLNKYIDEMKNNVFFSNLNISCIEAKLKPRYELYHKLHGFPENFNYDPELLQNIDDTLRNLLIL
jgi:hypothetical protein